MVQVCIQVLDDIKKVHGVTVRTQQCIQHNDMSKIQFDCVKTHKEVSKQ